LNNNPDRLADACIGLLENDNKRQQLGNNLAAVLAHPQAARELAQLLLKTANPK
jgi:UDP-N-acetylglucosamine:LPS N-acetylglucosamine transferase